MIAGEHAGVLSQGESGALSFAYLRGYRGIPLSSAMPLSTRTYRDKVVLPYLWGLLPEDPITRERVAADADISPNNPFAPLGVIGLDCPGAVQFCPPDTDILREERLVPIDIGKIARRLRFPDSAKPRSGRCCALRLQLVDMHGKQVIQVDMESTVIGAGAFEYSDAACHVELGDPVSFALELGEPCLNIIDAL